MKILVYKFIVPNREFLDPNRLFYSPKSIFPANIVAKRDFRDPNRESLHRLRQLLDPIVFEPKVSIGKVEKHLSDNKPVKKLTTVSTETSKIHMKHFKSINFDKLVEVLQFPF
jgi:hypothetical protein